MTRIILLIALLAQVAKSQILNPVPSGVFIPTVNLNLVIPTASGTAVGTIYYDPSSDNYDVTEGSLTYLGSNVASCDYKIYAPPSSSPLNFSKVVILLEGFDQKNNLYVDEIFDKLKDLGPDILTALGYHVLVVNFTDSHDYIERNALMLVELIKQINNLKTGHEENIIIGASMGGLVARYALTTMENMGIGHECNLFMSIDVPHRGVNIPVGVQEHVRDMVNNSLMQLPFNNGAAVNASLDTLFKTLTSPSSSQMNRHLIGSNGFPDAFPDSPQPLSSNFLKFFTKLRSLNNSGCGRGYPGDCKNVAISFGALNGFGQTDVNNSFVVPGTVACSYTVASPFLNTLVAPWVCSLLGLPPFLPLFTVSSDLHNYPFSNSGIPMITNQSKVFVVPATTHHHASNSLIDVAPGGYQKMNFAVANGVVEAVKNKSSAWNAAASNFVSTAVGFSVPVNLGAFSSNTLVNNYTHNFVPILSSLDYADVNLFRNIAADISNNVHLTMTPFDEIIGDVTGKNTEHIEDISDELLDDAKNAMEESPISVCGNPNFNITGANPTHRLFQKAQFNLSIDNSVINQTNLFELKAGSEVALLNNTSILAGSEGSVYIRPCATPKACGFSFSSPKSMSGYDPSWDMNGTPEDYYQRYIENKYCLESKSVEGTNYFYYKNCNSSDTSFISPSATEINTITKSKISGLLISPNPNNGNFTILTDVNFVNSEIVITNMLGQIIFSSKIENENRLEISLPNAEKGVYNIHLKKQDVILLSEKFIIQ